MGRRFLDLHVHSQRSTGKNSPEDLISTSKRIKTNINFCDGTGPEEGLEICFENRSKIKKVEKKALYLIIAPNSKETFQWALKNKGSIIRTDLSYQRARLIKEKKCFIEICLSNLIGSFGIGRIRAIKAIKTTLMFARKFDTKMIVTTGSKEIYDLRSPYQIHELLIVLGFTEDEAIKSMYDHPRQAIESGRERVEGKYVMEGVRIQ